MGFFLLINISWYNLIEIKGGFMPVKQYKNRKDVPDKYKWDLESMLQGKTPEQLIKEFEKLFKDLIAVKDSKYESKEAFLKALKKEDELSKISYILQNWAFNKLSENLVDGQANAFAQNFQFLAYNLAQELGPEEPRIFANQKNIEKWLEGKEFEVYRSTYARIFETKKHQLPKAIQEFRVAESRADIHAEQTFAILTDAETDFGFATDSKGKEIKVTRANVMALAKHKDKKVRKTSSLSFRQGFLNHKETLSNLLYQHFKHTTTWAKLEKFDSTIDYLLFDDRSSEKLLLSLYQSVQNNKQIRKQYKDLYSKAYKVKYKEAPTKYDMKMPLVDVQSEYTIETMQKEVLNAFKPFGKEYTDVIEKAFAEKWIDYQPVDNKRSGAYSIGETYSLDKKYILMNNEGTIYSMETLAHELGHSMHSYFSDKANHIREAGYKIFVAEIASIFNELMLFDHMLKTSDNDKLKFKIRQQIAEGFESTVFRQVQWSNYEYDLYKAIEEGKPVSTFKQIAEVYYENSKKYAVKIDKFKEEDQFAAIYVPHFYYDFYVYKYAIGQLVANIFFQRYKEHGPKALEEYVEKFLSAGSRLTPLEVLKANGIDLEDPKTYEAGFAPAYENIKELNKLAKKLFKF